MTKRNVGIVTLVFIAIATVVFAQGPGSAAGGPPFAGGFRGPGPFGGPSGAEEFQPGYGPSFHGRFGGGAYLGLSKEQIDKMRDLRTRLYTETRDLRYELAQKRLEMQKLFTDPKTDESALRAKQMELISLWQKMQDNMAQMMIEGRKILTPEQLQKLDQIPMGARGTMMPGMMIGPDMS
jgi:Spy/CpxP family protein refolding chaperone